MLMQILLHTPRWVFVLFLVLLVAGLSQLAGRRVGWRRVAVLPLVFTALSFFGVVSAFGEQPLALLAWLTALGSAAAAVAARPLPGGTFFDRATRRFGVPGSAVPLGLMMGIFFAKYAAGVSLSVSPALALSAGFALPVSAAYGAMSGIFLGRALRLWRLAAPHWAQWQLA